MDIGELRQRWAELSDREKQAWADLNFVLGAKAEVERLLVLAEEKTGENP